MSSILEAVNSVSNFLGMAACEKSNKVEEDAISHTLFLSVR